MPQPRYFSTFRHIWRANSFRIDALLPAHTVDCPACGQRVVLPNLLQGQEARCPRCNHDLVQVEKNPLVSPLAYASTSLILMAFVYTMLFITVSLPGLTSILSLPSMIHVLLSQDFGFLAAVSCVLVFGTPLVFLLLCLYVYTALVREKNYPALFYATRTMVRLRHWIMVDVFFISVLVAYIKLTAVADVSFGPAFGLMFILAVMLIRTSVSIPEHWVYYKLHRIQGRSAIVMPSEDKICCSRCLYFRDKKEKACGVCGADLFARRPYSFQLSLAFLIAATVLYVPANLLTIMISSNPMTMQANTIFNGIQYMWHDGDKLIAVIIFSASIAVPTLKIISMAMLLFSAKFRPLMSAPKLALQYRLTEAVGRWSMIDIFVIIILMSSFHSNIARVTPGPATVYFCLVVLLTMLSAYFFDPRLLWDNVIAKSSENLTNPYYDQNIHQL